MYVDAKFDVLCMCTCPVDEPTLTPQVMTSTLTTAGSPDTPSRITPSTRSETSSSTSGSLQNSGPEHNPVYVNMSLTVRLNGIKASIFGKSAETLAYFILLKDKMTDERKAACGRAEKAEEYDDVAGLKYEPKLDSEPQQSSEGDNKAPNADMLYAVVDKSNI